jgi:hypothetical protein
MARPEVTGRKIYGHYDTPEGSVRIRGPPLAAVLDLATALDLVDAYTIAEFCKAHRISRSTYYVLKNRGLGPDETHLLDRIIITKESAAAWRRKRTAASKRKRAA